MLNFGYELKDYFLNLPKGFCGKQVLTMRSFVSNNDRNVMMEKFQNGRQTFSPWPVQRMLIRKENEIEKMET